MRFFYGGMVILGVLGMTGCQTLQQPKPVASHETHRDVQKALGSITEAISGKTLSDKELKKLSKDLRTDKEARSAIKVITDTMSGRRRVKYCPVTGRRYAPNLTVCPEHGVPLKDVSDE